MRFLGGRGHIQQAKVNTQYLAMGVAHSAHRAVGGSDRQEWSRLLAVMWPRPAPPRWTAWSFEFSSVLLAAAWAAGPKEQRCSDGGDGSGAGAVRAGAKRWRVH